MQNSYAVHKLGPFDTVLMPHRDADGAVALPFYFTSHFFFKDFDETIVAVSDKPGKIYFLDKEAEAKRDARISGVA
jgi:hypothetical protein